MEYTITKNAQYNSIEILFDAKPAEAIREALKGLKFRWNGKKGVWYGYTTEEEARAAIEGKEPKKAEAAKQTKKPAKINLDGLEKNKKTAYGADFAAVLREDLKKRGASGFSIRSHRGGYTDSFTITIKMEAEDFRSAEEAAARDGWMQFFNRQELGGGVDVDGVNYSKWNAGREDATHKYISTGNGWTDGETSGNFETQRRFFMGEIARLCSVNPYHMTADRYPELTAAAFDRVYSILRVVQSYNYDNSDPMSDYFDVGFYLDIDLKKPDGFTPREYMTEEEKAQFIKDKEAEDEAERARMAEYERQRKEAEEAEARRAEQEKKDRAEVAAAVTVEDLPRPVRITALLGGYGKENTVEEVKAENNRTPTNAEVVRRVRFDNSAACDKFGRMLLYDWDFLAGMGGTGTNDPRVTDANFWKLNSEQRGQVEFHPVKCVAVYLGDVLQFVANPEGYSYARYILIPTDFTEEISADETERITKEEESADVAPFYFPAPVEEQAQGLNVGNTVTAYQVNGWSLMVDTLSGVLESAEPGTYAQYKGVWLTIRKDKKTTKRLFIRDNGGETVIFNGPALDLPDSVIYESVKDSGSAILKQYRGYTDQIKETIKYYAENGRKPALDTVQR